jgi:hypothetical protein
VDGVVALVGEPGSGTARARLGRDHPPVDPESLVPAHGVLEAAERTLVLQRYAQVATHLLGGQVDLQSSRARRLGERV